MKGLHGMKGAAFLTRLGIDAPRLRFALRTAPASCVALWLAWALGLEHPQWAAMSVWSASQPLRGQLLEKGFFRVAGTMLGGVIGVALVAISGDNTLSLVAGLSVWIGLCAAIGNLLRGFLAHGAVLAGFSAAMIALLDSQGAGDVYALGVDRILTVLVGVLVIQVTGAWFTPKRAESDLTGRLRRLSARVLRVLAAHDEDAANGERRAWPRAELRSIVGEMALIEENLDAEAAGSLEGRRAARAVRDLLSAQLSALLWRGGHAASADVPEGVREALCRAARVLEEARPSEEALHEIERAASLARSRPELHARLEEIAAVGRQRLGYPEPAAAPARVPSMRLHRDWIGARQAAIRATVAMLAIGVPWALTGFFGGSYMLLGLAVMLSMFSSHENPQTTMIHFTLGRALGAALALVCRWLVWPDVVSDLGRVLTIMPFVFLGAFVLSHRRLLPGGIQSEIVLLLLLQPLSPIAETVPASLLTAIFVAAAPAIAFLAYLLIFPVDTRARMRTLIAMMVHEVEAMARARRGPEHAPIWRARLRHRLLRLARFAEKTHETSALEGGFALLELGGAVLALQALTRRRGLRPETVRAIELALERIARVGRDPERARRALDRVARRLEREGRQDEAERFARAADDLGGSLGFFRGGEGRFPFPVSRFPLLERRGSRAARRATRRAGFAEAPPKPPRGDGEGRAPPP